MDLSRVIGDQFRTVGHVRIPTSTGLFMVLLWFGEP